MVTHFDDDVGGGGEPHVGARAEAHQANAFAARDDVASFLPRHHAARDVAGDLLEDNFAVLRGQRENILFILRGGVGAHGGEELAGLIVEPGDGAGGGRAVNVHVPDGKENTDALTGDTGVHFIGDDHYPAVGGGDDGAGLRRDGARGIAEKREAEQAEERQHRRYGHPVQKKENHTQKQRWNAEVVAFFNHALEKITTGREVVAKPRRVATKLPRGRWSRQSTRGAANQPRVRNRCGYYCVCGVLCRRRREANCSISSFTCSFNFLSLISSRRSSELRNCEVAILWSSASYFPCCSARCW